MAFSDMAQTFAVRLAVRVSEANRCVDGVEGPCSKAGEQKIQPTHYLCDFCLFMMIV